MLNFEVLTYSIEIDVKNFSQMIANAVGFAVTLGEANLFREFSR
jgi:hypothetical protein